MKAPALKLVFPFAAGIGAAFYLQIAAGYLFVPAVILLPFLALAYLKQKQSVFAVLAGTALLLLGMILTALQNVLPTNHISLFTDLPTTVAVEGLIISPPDVRQSHTNYVVKVDSIWLYYQPFAVSGKCQIAAYLKHPTLRYGDRILFKGRLQVPPKSRNPGEFNYQGYLKAQDIYATTTISESNALKLLSRGEGDWFGRELVYPVRDYFIRFIDAAVPHQAGALLKGLLVGARGEIDDSIRESFAKVGVIHVLAVSGLHVGFILFGLLYILHLFRLPQPIRTLLILFGLYYYAYLTGFHAPVVRASIMAGILVAGGLFKRNADPLNSIALAGLYILVLSPLDLFQVGFQLSFAAVTGIILIYERLYKIFKKSFFAWQEKGNRIQMNLVILFLVSLAAQLATLPLTAYYFGRIPLFSLVANIVVVPFVGIIVGLGFIAILASLIIFPAGIAFATTDGILLNVLIKIISFGGSIPFSHLQVARPSAWLMVIYFTLLLVIVFWHKFLVRKVAFVLILVILNLVIYFRYFESKELEIIFFDVGQGDSALLRFPNGRNLLIDAGDRTDKLDSGKRVLLPYFQRFDIATIDNLLITHNHSDHAGGSIALLENMKVGRVIKSALMDTSFFERAVDSLARLKKVPLLRLGRGDTIQVDDKALVLLFNPPKRSGNNFQSDLNLNNFSLVVKVIYGQTSFLFTGDAEREAEGEMMAYGPLLRADVLKVGHHGSSTSSSETFRKLVRPFVAVISLKKYNRFGLPSKKVVQGFRNDGVVLLRTDESGAIRMRSNGRLIKLE